MLSLFMHICATVVFSFGLDLCSFYRGRTGSKKYSKKVKKIEKRY